MSKRTKTIGVLDIISRGGTEGALALATDLCLLFPARFSGATRRGSAERQG